MSTNLKLALFSFLIFAALGVITLSRTVWRRGGADSRELLLRATTYFVIAFLIPSVVSIFHGMWVAALLLGLISVILLLVRNTGRKDLS